MVTPQGKTFSGKTFLADSRDWYSPKEAAPMLGIAERTLWEWLESGRIVALQPGGPGTHLRIPLSAIEAALQRRKGT